MSASDRLFVRQIAAWLAIFGLYVQLAAAALCTCGLPTASAAPGAFPICHSHSAANAERGTKQAQNDRAPAHHEQQCPFCTVHCHAAMVMAPSLAALDHVSIAAQPAQVAAFVIPSPARFSLSAPPRGPPPSV
ncbi:MAG: DUF2946 family protein [Methylovirgula sp.]|jgi:hypothetical protein